MPATTAIIGPHLRTARSALSRKVALIQRRSSTPRALLVLISILATAGGAVRAGAIPPRDSALGASLEQEVVAARRVARGVGVHVVDLADRREVYGYQADHERILASNTKLFTTAAALTELGPDFQFETRLLMRGTVEGGVLRGDLAVVAGGDPNLSGRSHDGDALAPFRPWARVLAERGIRRIDGDLYLVNGMFDQPRIHPDWPRNQLTAWYEAPIDALSFSDNCVLVRIQPGAKGGVAARVTTDPPIHYFEIRNSARTVSGRWGHLIVSRLADSDTLVVSGTVGALSGGLDTWVAVHDPEAYFAAALRAAFAEEGVAVGGRDHFVHGGPQGSWERVAAHASDLVSTITVTNKRSQNFYAESLAKFLGWKSFGHGSWENAVHAIGRALVRLGLAPDQFQLADGSGLSRADRATPRAVTDLLEKMYFHPYGREFVQSLPYSGEEGLSWRRRLAAPPYRGNVFAKTGTLDGVSALSGYAKAVSGRVYAFSILLNQVRGNGSAHAAQDRIVRALIDRG